MIGYEMVEEVYDNLHEAAADFFYRTASAVYAQSADNKGFVKSSRSANALRADAVRFQKIDNPTTAVLTQPAQSTDVPIDRDIVISFNNTIDAATINSSTVVLHDLAGSTVSAALSLSTDGKTLTVHPNFNLIPYRTYTVSLG